MKRSWKSLVVALTIVASLLVAALSGCGGKTETPRSGEEDEEVVVVLAATQDPTSIDPHKVGGDPSARVTAQVHEALFRFNEEWQVEPWLARDWEQVSDTEWIFYLNEGITFSNGEPFNAEAVVYNLDRAASTEYPRQAFDYRNYYDHSEAIDEYTVKVVMTQYCSMMLAYMADVPMAAPEHTESVGEDKSSQGLIGTGPYVIESWVPNQQITLKARDDWWKGKVDVDTFIIRTIPERATQIAELLAGRVDIVEKLDFESIPTLETAGCQVLSKKERRVHYIAFNTCDWSPSPALKDRRVRLALNYAVDREAILENLLGGYGTLLPSWYRADQPFYLEDLKGIPYDPQKAKELLAEAGYADGFDVVLETDTSTTKGVEICQAVADYIQAVGVNCTVRATELNTMRNVIINGQAQKLAQGMFLWSWAGKPGMIESWLTGIVMSDGMSSYNHVEGYDELCAEILSMVRLEDRKEGYETFQRKLLEDPPYIYLHQEHSIYGLSPKLIWNPDADIFIRTYQMSVRK